MVSVLSRPLLAFLPVLLVLFVLILPTRGVAQERVWIQIEANATLEQALDRARSYDAMFDNLAGFRLGTGWYALVLGPYVDREVADDIRIDLRARGMIPGDAFIATEGSYGQPYWPQGRADPRARPPADTADVAAPEPVTSRAPAAEPAIAEPREETLAEARRSEGQLTRAERESIQIALAWGGYYTLGIDGAFGPGTRRAMTAYQAAMGFEQTGVLSTRQRLRLIEDYEAELAAIGMQTYRDDRAGIEIDLPLGLVAFERHDAPFAHFVARGDSGVRAYLISQRGDRAALGALYEIMQSLEIVPTEGERSLRANGFLLTGRSDQLRSHSVVQLSGGQIKGWTLVWTPDQDAAMARVLPVVEGSFRSVTGVLPDTAVSGASEVARPDLIAGLQVRRPLRAASGFFVDNEGHAVTSLATVEGCGRITLDETVDAELRLSDSTHGVAVLSPRSALAPLATASFAAAPPRIAAEIAVAGYSYADLLSRPIVSFGSLADLRGLDGETDLRRLNIAIRSGDAGGPVFDGSGAVFGMVLPRPADGAQMLPEDVHFALGAETLIAVLERGGLSPRRASGTDSTASREALARRAVQMAVLVSCWEN